MATVVMLPTRQQAAVPLYEAIETLVAATGRVLLADQEHAGTLPDEVKVSLASLRRAFSDHQVARELSDELAAETGRPILHVVARSAAPP